jgi:hypothetical protein
LSDIMVLTKIAAKKFDLMMFILHERICIL